jgi:U2-associated protein SR140
VWLYQSESHTFSDIYNCLSTLAVFGDDDEEDERNKELEAKAKAAYKPNIPSQSSSSTVSGKTGSANTSGFEPESTPYVRDAKAKRKKEMDAFLEELKR